MIYFARKPDAVCFPLLRLSLDLAEFAIRRDIDSFATTFPHVSRWSTPKRIAKDINWLQGLLVSPVVYRLTEAAMRVVYDALILFLTVHNRGVGHRARYHNWCPANRAD